MSCCNKILTWNIKRTKTQIPPGDFSRRHLFSVEKTRIGNISTCALHKSAGWYVKTGLILVWLFHAQIATSNNSKRIDCDRAFPEKERERFVCSFNVRKAKLKERNKSIGRLLNGKEDC